MTKQHTGRDWALVKLICGATKGGPHQNKKKTRNKKACRKPVKQED
jgi:hypothetical protein